MINICLVGFGRLGFRYLQAISKLTLKINLYIVDKNTKRFKKLNEIKNSINKDLKVSFSKNFKKIPKKIDLIIVSTTCGSYIVISFISELCKSSFLHFNPRYEPKSNNNKSVLGNINIKNCNLISDFINNLK